MAEVIANAETKCVYDAAVTLVGELEDLFNAMPEVRAAIEAGGSAGLPPNILIDAVALEAMHNALNETNTYARMFGVLAALSIRAAMKQIVTDTGSVPEGEFEFSDRGDTLYIVPADD